MTYTSLELSKKLLEAGFKGESEKYWYGFKEDYPISYIICPSPKGTNSDENYERINAYDILNDLCVRYAKEVFGELPYDNFIGILGTIVTRLQAGKKEEAEEFLWANSILNPENL